MNCFIECRRGIFILAISFFFVTVCGCKQEDPNPELKDPIYVDLLRRATEARKGYEEELKKQGDISSKLEKTEANSIERKRTQRDLDKSKHSSFDYDQTAKYYEIRAKRRLHVDRMTYKAAFAAGKPWPDKHEYSDYQVNMRLQEVQRNWNARVPKLQERLLSSTMSEEKGDKKPEKAEKSGH
jgi:hypothetical protein